MNHAPGAGSIARQVDQQSSALPLYHGCPNERHDNMNLLLMEIIHLEEVLERVFRVIITLISNGNHVQNANRILLIY